MKSLRLMIMLLLGAVLFVACSDDQGPTDNGPDIGNIGIQSSPTGAQIWLNGENTGKTTDDTLYDVSAGEAEIQLMLDGYRDTTFTVEVLSDFTTVEVIYLEQLLTTTYHNNVRLWESTGTTVDQPSGIDLSTGETYGISGDMADSVDFYFRSAYSSTSVNYEFRSQALYSDDLTRNTYFYVTTSMDIDDSEDAPVFSNGSWKQEVDLNAYTIGNLPSPVIFVYDEDGHYSKMQIVSTGGEGTSSSPVWYEVDYYYNETDDDNRF